MDIGETEINRAKGSLLGLALGDALGTTLKLELRDRYSPLTDLAGGGPFHLEAGQWTDETAMMLCLSDSLLICKGHNPEDQMQRYCRWYRHGENSCTGKSIDIGSTVRGALERFEMDGNPMAGETHELSAGNRSLVRSAPVALFYARAPSHELLEVAALASTTTHGEERCIQACQWMCALIVQALKHSYGMTKAELLSVTAQQLNPELHPDIQGIVQGDYQQMQRDQISGSGFVVDALEAALWCFWTTETFEEGALLAANLGDDADTTAAIYGQLAGAWYGAGSLPSHWLEKLAWREQIAAKAEALVTAKKN